MPTGAREGFLNVPSVEGVLANTWKQPRADDTVHGSQELAKVDPMGSKITAKNGAASFASRDSTKRRYMRQTLHTVSADVLHVNGSEERALFVSRAEQTDSVVSVLFALSL